MISLTREVGLKVGPAILEVLVKHWFDRLKKDAEDGRIADSGARLKEDDILYHQAFVIVKAFLSAATSHTIEEVQSFFNTRTPSPPWVHVVRTIVPLSCCDDAAKYLIKALGGEDVAKQVVGGVKWWQVRGMNGVDAQWITMKKDWEEAKKRHKMQHGKEGSNFMSPPSSTENECVYEKDMDAMRCILYLHGGGYYFGSVDQTRYSIQRHARKLNGRVFAINYRLAPQYPFPCGLHDALAAYLFLIRPPPGSAHQAVNPGHIIISGDSAGGGLCLALLQVIRDSGLPLPAGGALISPWCDLAHSFPSVHKNASSDFIPDSGLSFHKPSLLWPPPSSDISKHVHASLRFRIKQAFRLNDAVGPDSQTSTTISEQNVSLDSRAVDPTATVPTYAKEKVIFRMESGEDVAITEQLHFYTVNSLVTHPLVSPITGYLGGLPPLLFITGDDEVLRDEIIYTAHKAAYPEKYPIVPSVRSLYPILDGIEERHKPTSVHIQVYDGTPHILPVLFSFTTPAKFCFRAIANFNRFVTDMKVPHQKTMNSRPYQSSLLRRKSLFARPKSPSSHTESDEVPQILGDRALTSSPPAVSLGYSAPASPVQELDRPSLRRAISSRISRAGSLLRRHKVNRDEPLVPTLQGSTAMGDVSDPSSMASGPTLQDSSETTAGESQVYADIENRVNWECRMIRERVSTSGVIRPLEPEDELDACKMPHELVAQLCEKTVERYLKNKRKFVEQFDHTLKSIEKDRRRNLARAKEDTIKRVSVLRQTIVKKRDGGSKVERAKLEANSNDNGQDKLEFNPQVLFSAGWTWSWALDEWEHPPPSSIVARRDTEEARRLAAVADWDTEDVNSLWTLVHNFLTATPTKGSHVLTKPRPSRKLDHQTNPPSGFGGNDNEDDQGKDSSRVNTGDSDFKKRSSIFAKFPSRL